MSTEARAFALRNALNEIKNVCPDVSNTFIFRENGEIIAEDENTNQTTINDAQETFRDLIEKTKVIGEIESVTFKGENARANITRFRDFYVANVASNKVDEKTVTNLSCVMIPTLLRLVQEIYPASNITKENVQKPEETLTTPEISVPEPQTCQLTVEHLGFGSFLKDSNVALIDNALIGQWNEIYGDNQITKVSLENPINAKSLICQFKSFKESKYEGKGVIQLSEKTQLALKVERGAQIVVKPVIGQSEGETPDLAESEESTTEAGASTLGSSLAGDVQSCFLTAPVNQFMVENVGGMGFLRNNEFARVDSGVIARWEELFADKQIDQITIEETLTGRRLTCKFKPIKASELEGKGVIQLPDKIQQALQIKKGALVVVKPVVEA
jgi:hypothetical protein